MSGGLGSLRGFRFDLLGMAGLQVRAYIVLLSA